MMAITKKAQLCVFTFLDSLGAATFSIMGLIGFAKYKSLQFFTIKFIATNNNRPQFLKDTHSAVSSFAFPGGASSFCFAPAGSAD